MDAALRHLRRSALLAGGLTDGQLLDAFLSRRDEAAFEALLRRLGPMVLGVCRRVLGDPHDAADAFQAACLVLVRKAASLRGKERVGSWLYGVAYRTAAQHRRALTRRRRREAPVADLPHPAALPESLPFDAEALDRELSRLPDKYRVAVVACELEGRPRKAVARELGLPEGTLSSRLAAARKMLARRLSGLALSGGLAAAVCVPADLTAATARAATASLAGGTAAGLVSPTVAALTEGALKMMALSPVKKAAAAVLVASALWAGVSASAGRAGPEPAPPEPAPQLRRELSDLKAQAADLGRRIDDLERKLARAEEDDLAWSRLGVRGREETRRVESGPRGPRLVTKKAVRIVAVRADGPAARAGLREGDVLVGLWQWEMADLKALDYALRHPDVLAAPEVTATFDRDGQVRRASVRLDVPEESRRQAEHRTTNFVVIAPDAETAEAVGKRAEAERKRQALAWLGQEMPDWPQRCRVRVRLKERAWEATGSTTFTSDQAGPTAMELTGPLDCLLADELPGQMAHAVLHDELGIAAPRWAGPGMALVEATRSKRERYERACHKMMQGTPEMPLRRLLGLREYPQDVRAYYAEGMTLTQFLVERKDRATFLAFVGLGMRKDWDAAVRRYYGLDGVEELEARWRRWQAGER
jgi:RNA polymerase sigma factor (sigma-70 family)